MILLTHYIFTCSREYFDLVDGQQVLLDLVKIRGVKIHTNLFTALQCTGNILRNSSNNGVSADDLIAEYLRYVTVLNSSFYNKYLAFSVLCDYP